MHEHLHHQASGLLGLHPAAQAQLLAVVRHGDGSCELPALWRLCSSLLDLNLPVTVLDGSQQEDPASPGLQQWLSQPTAGPSHGAAGSEFQVLPSAQGLRTLCLAGGTGSLSLQRLAALSPDQGVLVLYADAGLLAHLLAGTPVSPLLCLGDQPESLLGAYRALKSLHLRSGLQAVLLHLAARPHNRRSDYSDAACANLRSCARDFLGYDLDTITIDTSHSEQLQGSDGRRLALQLLQRALTLQTSAWMPLQYHGLAHGAGAARSH